MASIHGTQQIDVQVAVASCVLLSREGKRLQPLLYRGMRDGSQPACNNEKMAAGLTAPSILTHRAPTARKS